MKVDFKCHFFCGMSKYGHYLMCKVSLLFHTLSS